MNRILIVFILLLNQDIAAQPKTEWWRSTTVYQIYPRSYYDTDGDGIGDLNGIISKLDYIQSLGFQTIWISPFFKSKQQDFGYDISDYYSIAPEYGDMATCEKLIGEVHQRNMKIVFDLVMNHTSNQHEWFKESAASKTNAKADWYVWKNGKGKNGTKAPNNWKAMIGGSGWHYDSTRQQFYWASFLPFQPDLNYHNPEVKQAMLDVAKFWLAKGVDGFRLDIFNAVYEDESLHDNPFSFRIVPSEENPNGFFQKMKYNINQEKSFEFATELRNTVDSFENKFLVGEVFGDNETLKKFCEYNGKKGLNSVFLFKTLGTSFKAKPYKKMVEDFEQHFGEPFMPTYVFSNHDRKRSFSRLDESIDKAKLLALFQYTVRGIPFTYNGEELSMAQTEIPFNEAQDAIAHRFKPFHQKLAKMVGETLNRDECRTPMLWNDSANAGFTATNAKPWLPVAPNYKEINASKQQADENSLMSFYKKIISIRNETDAMQSGSLQIAEDYCSREVFGFYRMLNGEKYLTLLNMSKKKILLDAERGNLLLSTHTASSDNVLMPYEGKLIKIQE